MYRWAGMQHRIALGSLAESRLAPMWASLPIVRDLLFSQNAASDRRRAHREECSSASKERVRRAELAQLALKPAVEDLA
jgi:hypothetical protein